MRPVLLLAMVLAVLFLQPAAGKKKSKQSSEIERMKAELAADPELQRSAERLDRRKRQQAQEAAARKENVRKHAAGELDNAGAPDGSTFNPATGMHEMHFAPPKMTDEEKKSEHIPDWARCDTCAAIVEHLRVNITVAESHISGRRVKESQLIEIAEETCTSDVFGQYGFKTVDKANAGSKYKPGQKVLEGLYSPHGTKIAGFKQGGGSIPNRFAKMCTEIIGAFGEAEFYELMKDPGADLKGAVCVDFCKEAKLKPKRTKTERTFFLRGSRSATRLGG